jgi:multiple sugar transport system permease protein/fructooligosaccharide transport system permease protein
MVVTSGKPMDRIFADLNSINALLPIGFTFDNYVKAFHKLPLLKYIGTSVIYVTTIAVSGLIVNSLCGYALAKLKFRGRNFVLTGIIVLLIVPFESILLPLYFVVNSLKWINTMQALIVPFISNCFSIFMFRQFFMEIPDDLLEAAAIDGSTPLRTFLTIVVPASGPVFTTVFILDYVSHWGDFMWPILAVTGDSLRTIQLGIQALFTLPPIYYGEIMAALTISTLPIVIMFLCLQKYYIQGITHSGIKG